MLKFFDNKSPDPALKTEEPLDYVDLMQSKIDRIGRGNYSSVYRGEWNNQVVAIKCITSGTDVESEKEKEILRYISEQKSPYIIKYIGYAIGGREYCIVMEYASHLLSSQIENNSPFEWPLRLNIMRTAIEGVAFLHKNNIIHRDIKSSNILLTAEGNAKIADFGLADYANQHNNESCGTAAWAAPEVLSNMAYTTKADIFSLGVTLWEVAAWESPCDGMPTFVVIFARAKEHYRDAIPNEVPKSIAHLISWSWMANPDERPSAEEIAQHLEGFSLV